ncbi:MAG TPA: hypothetical protein VJ233_08900 [Hyphomicrobiaceae bacterium]|nr:hypothetical protein [Hyphomicrobiaceae bacterium]
MRSIEHLIAMSVMPAANNANANSQLQLLRADMERELTLRHRINWGVTLVVLTLSIIISGIGATGGIDLLAALGQWRTGVLVLTGAALLFSFAILLQHLVQSRSERDLKYARELSDSLSRTEKSDNSKTGSLSV